MKTSAAALALLLAGPLQAQAQDAPRPVKVSVETVAAEVEVLVVDKKGSPVDGLTRDDFRLFVNGKEMPLDWFEAPPAPSVSATASVPAAPAAAAAPPVTTSTPSPRAHSTVFVISSLHVDAGAQRAGLDALRAYADRLPDGEQASVYLLDNGARRLLGFTSDRKELKKAIDRPRRILPSSYAFDVRNDEWVGRSRQMLRNLGAVLDSLASRPEPKTVVMLTGPLWPTGNINPSSGAGLFKGPGAAAGGPRTSASPLDAASAITHYSNPVTTRGERQWNFLGEARDLENQAFLARATVVALDPSGILAPAGQADSKTPDDRDLLAASDSWEFRNDTFALIAEATGGARLGFSNKPVDLILGASRLLAKRYRLGFTPPDGTSARRDIRVEMTRPGLVVRTASGQRSLTAETAARARFAGLLLSSGAPQGDFTIAVEMKSRISNRTDDALPFDILVPVSGVYAEERGESKRAELELLVSAVDDEGRASEPIVIPFSVELTTATARDGAFFRKDSSFSIDKRWKGRLFVGVRDTATNRLGAVAMPIGG
jgi:VWFA-related protein